MINTNYFKNTDTLQGASYGRPSMIRSSEFDVRPVTLADFDDPDTRANAFIHCTALCSLVGEIHSLSLSSRSIEPESIVRVFAAIRNWLHDLPDDLLLYCNGIRNAYFLPVFNLYQLYLASIIWLYLLPGVHRNSRSLHTLSFVASSCIAQLYEEIIYHEEVHLLLPIHGWICTVAAVLQIYSVSKFPDQESTTAKELDIITSVVTGMASKHASSAMVLRKIVAFRQNETNLPNMVSPETQESNGISHEQRQIVDQDMFRGFEDMLPFPNSMSMRMDLLQLVSEGSGAMIDQFVPPFRLEDIDWTLEWPTLALDDSGRFGGFVGNDIDGWDDGSIAH